MNRANACTATRLAERTKSQYYLGKTNENLISDIDGVTQSQVEEAIKGVLNGPLTFVVRGGEVGSLPSYDKISNLLN